MKWTGVQANAAYPAEMSLLMEPTYEGSVSEVSWQDGPPSASDLGAQRKKTKKRSRKRSAHHMLEASDNGGAEVPKKRSKKKRHS